VTSVLLIDPKYAHNLGAVVRACAVFGARELRWTGDRATRDMDRLPREERLHDYRRKVDFAAVSQPLAERPVDLWTRHGSITPVAVEVLDSAEPLTTFVHPQRAVYVFGPEDGGLPKGIRNACHRFVTIPADGCLNLSAAVNVVLYDRMTKALRIKLPS
jgi:tRNA(Leu) C34 or U34 (ribose-2'-O)-methylase TrmL